MSCGPHIYIIFVRGPSCTAAGGEQAYVPAVGGSVLASPPHGGVVSVPAKRFRLRNVARDLLTAQAHRKSSLPPHSTSYNACLSWYQLWSAVSNFRFLPSRLGRILKQTQKSYDHEIPVALEEFKRVTPVQYCVSNDRIAVGRHNLLIESPVYNGQVISDRKPATVAQRHIIQPEALSVLLTPLNLHAAIGPPTFTSRPFKEKELKSEEPKLIEFQEVDGQAGHESFISAQNPAESAAAYAVGINQMLMMRVVAAYLPDAVYRGIPYLTRVIAGYQTRFITSQHTLAVNKMNASSKKYGR
ncbi:hypothetical protein C8J57DRAFT_1239205 [Mycena rebaudengoi]|nr:hypothetical protein C8J57DRAFT_1239205 [Mycena rebaudengoi]